MKLTNKIKDFLIQKYEYSVFQSILIWLIPVILSSIISVSVTYLVNDLRFFLFTLIIMLIFSVILIIALPIYELNIMKLLKKSRKSENWIEIIRIAYPLSQSLWYLGKHKVHYLLGREIDNACRNLMIMNHNSVTINDKKVPLYYIRCITLAHNLGWTLYKLNHRNLNQSMENIYRSHEIAKEHKDTALNIELLKQMVALQVEKDKSILNIAEYKNEIDRIFETNDFKKLTNEEQKNLKGNWYYTYAASILTTLKNNTYNECEKTKLIKEALENINQSSYEYSDNPERNAKTYTVKAELLIEEGSYISIINTNELVEQGLIYCDFYQERNRYCRLAVIYMKLRLMEIERNSQKNEDLSTMINEIRDKYKMISRKLINMNTDKNYKKEFDQLYKMINQLPQFENCC